MTSPDPVLGQGILGQYAPMAAQPGALSAQQQALLAQPGAAQALAAQAQQQPLGGTGQGGQGWGHPLAGMGAAPGSMPGFQMGPSTSAGYFSPGVAGNAAIQGMGMLGPLGMAAGSAARLGIGIHNTMNTNRQLAAAGLQPMGTWQDIGSALGVNGYDSQQGLNTLMGQQGIPSSVTSFGGAAQNQNDAIARAMANGSYGGGGSGFGGGSSGGYGGDAGSSRKGSDG